MNAEDKKFHDWRKRVNKDLPDVAARVFALRGKFYSGCGFHWSLERELGFVLAVVNDYDRGFDMAARIGLEVRVENLHRQLKEAEASATELAEDTP